MTIELERFHVEVSQELDEKTLERTLRDLEDHLATAALAAKDAPDSLDTLQELETTLTEAANIIQAVAPQNPELAQEAMIPFEEAAEVLVKSTQETALKKAEIAAFIAAKVHNVGEQGEKVAELADESVDSFFGQTHTESDDLGAKLDTNLAEAYKQSIRDKRKFSIALGRRIADAYTRTEEEEGLDVSSSLAQYRSERAEAKANRKAHFERKQVELDVTGVTPVDTVEEEPDDEENAGAPPSSEGQAAFEAWKKRLALQVTYKIGRTAMRDDEYERIITPEEANRLRTATEPTVERRAA